MIGEVMPPDVLPMLGVQLAGDEAADRVANDPGHDLGDHMTAMLASLAPAVERMTAAMQAGVPSVIRLRHPFLLLTTLGSDGRGGVVPIQSLIPFGVPDITIRPDAVAYLSNESDMVQRYGAMRAGIALVR
jgi:hypothetical protein